MDYNNNPLIQILRTNSNNTIYDKTFNNNNKLLNNNMKINISTQGNKLNWNYTYLKTKKEGVKKSNKIFKPIVNDKGSISKNIIKKYNLKNNNFNNASKNKTQNNASKNIVNKINIRKNNIINRKYNNNEILSKYNLYFKKIQKK